MRTFNVQCILGGVRRLFDALRKFGCVLSSVLRSGYPAWVPSLGTQHGNAKRLLFVVSLIASAVIKRAGMSQNQAGPPARVRRIQPAPQAPRRQDDPWGPRGPPGAAQGNQGAGQGLLHEGGVQEARNGAERGRFILRLNPRRQASVVDSTTSNFFRKNFPGAPPPNPRRASREWPSATLESGVRAELRSDGPLAALAHRASRDFIKKIWGRWS